VLDGKEARRWRATPPQDAWLDRVELALFRKPPVRLGGRMARFIADDPLI